MDQDIFQFTVPAFSNFHLDAVPFNAGSGDAGSNLDIQLDLLNEQKNIIGTSNPPDVLNATIDTVLNPGSYFIRIQGKGNANAPGYASLGSYNIKATLLPGSTLPLHKLNLQAKSEKNVHYLSWAVVADEPVIHQILEIAADGHTFIPLTSLPSDARSYSYTPLRSGMLTYRVHISLNDGHDFYSNLVSLNNIAGKALSFVNGNIIHSLLTVNSASSCNYAIIDGQGRIMGMGILKEGTNSINSSHWSSGLYIILIKNGQEEYREKFIKQQAP
jgi:hypothetical protein